MANMNYASATYTSTTRDSTTLTATHSGFSNTSICSTSSSSSTRSHSWVKRSWHRFRSTVDPAFAIRLSIKEAASCGDVFSLSNILGFTVRQRSLESDDERLLRGERELEIECMSNLTFIRPIDISRAFVLACRNGHLPCVQVLLAFGVKDASFEDNSALVGAINGHHWNVVEELFQIISPDVLNHHGPLETYFCDGSLMRVLYIWVEEGRDALVKIALPHCPDDMYWPCISLANRRRDKSLFQSLMSSSRSKSLAMDMSVCSMLGRERELISALSSHQHNCEFSCHERAMKMAVSSGHLTCFKLIFEHAKYLGLTFKFEYSSISWIDETTLNLVEELITYAAAAGQAHVLKALLSFDAINLNNPLMRLYALVDSSRANQVSTLQVLLDKLPCIQPQEVVEALLAAADERAVQAMRYLLSHPFVDERIVSYVVKRRCDECKHHKCTWTLTALRQIVARSPLEASASAA